MKNILTGLLLLFTASLLGQAGTQPVYYLEFPPSDTTKRYIIASKVYPVGELSQEFDSLSVEEFISMLKTYGINDSIDGRIGTIDSLYEATGYAGIDTDNPIAPLHIGDGTVSRSTTTKLLLTGDTETATAEHGFSDSYNITNGLSYNSYDARARITADINGVNGHYAGFQSIPEIATGINVSTVYNNYTNANNDGTIDDYYGYYNLSPLNTTNAYGFYLNGSQSRPSTTNQTGVFVGSMTAPAATGVAVSGVYGSTTSYGLSITGVGGTGTRRPIYTRVADTDDDSYIEFRNDGTALSRDILMLSRGSINVGTQTGMIFEAGSGATKYYSARISDEWKSGLSGDLVFHTNNAGGAGIGQLQEAARVTSDGDIQVQGELNLAQSLGSAETNSIYRNGDSLFYNNGTEDINLLTGDGVGISGSGTTNTIPKFTNSTTLGDGIASDDGDNFTIAGQALINGGIRLNYEIDNDLGTNMNFQIRSSAPTGVGGYFYRQVGYDATYDIGTGVIVSQTNSDHLFVTNASKILTLEDDGNIVHWNQSGVGNKLAYFDANGREQRSDIDITDPILNNGTPVQYEVPYYNSNTQLMDSDQDLKRDASGNVIIGDSDNNATGTQVLTIDGGGIGFKFSGVLPSTDDYLTVAPLSNIQRTSDSGTDIGVLTTGQTVDGVSLALRTTIIQSARDGLGNGIALITGAEKLGFTVNTSGHTNSRYNHTVDGELYVEDRTGDNATSITGAASDDQIVDVTLGDKLELTSGELNVKETNYAMLKMALPTSQSLNTTTSTKIDFDNAVSNGNFTASTTNDYITTSSDQPVLVNVSGQVRTTGACGTSPPTVRVRLMSGTSTQVAEVETNVSGLDYEHSFSITHIDASFTTSDQYQIQVIGPSSSCPLTYQNVSMTMMGL